MKPPLHFILTAILSVPIYVFTNSFELTLGFFLAGFFLDIDHVFDYFINHGFTLNPLKIYDCYIRHDLEKIAVPLHSIDFLLVYFIILIIIPIGSFWTGVFIGMAKHILIDELTVPMHKYGYLFSYRLYKGFKKEHIFLG